MSVHGAGENNLLPSQTIYSDQNEEVLSSAGAMTSLLSPPTNNSTSTNLSQNLARMKYYFHHKQNCISDTLMTQFLIVQSSM